MSKSYATMNNQVDIYLIQTLSGLTDVEHTNAEIKH